MTVTYNEDDTVWAPRGRAVADNGATYTSITDALDDATDMVMVGPGTFDESVEINQDDLTLMGSGRGTLIDGGVENAITVNGSNVSISALASRCDPDAGTSVDGINTSPGSDGLMVRDVHVLETDSIGILVRGEAATVIGCVVDNTGSQGIYYTSGGRGMVGMCSIGDGVSQNGVRVESQSTAVAACTIGSVGQAGVNIGGSNNSVVGTTVSGSTASGVLVRGDNNTIGDCTVRDSGNYSYSAENTDSVAISGCASINPATGHINRTGASALEVAGCTPNTMNNRSTASEGVTSLSSGSAVVSTGVTEPGSVVDVSLDPSGDGANAADVKVAARAFWDNSDGEYKVEIIEDGTSVGDPTVGYQVEVN